jgi:hypothetical protein
MPRLLNAMARYQLCRCDSCCSVIRQRCSTWLLQDQLQGAPQQVAPSSHTAKLEQQLSMMIEEIAHLRADASASASTIQAHVSTIKQMENRLGATEPSKVASGIPQPASPNHMSLAQSEIGKMLEKKQAIATHSFVAAAAF